jgi:hypothetical protein
VTGLGVVHAEDDGEPAVPPFVPHRRQERLAVRAVGGEDGDEGPLEQIPELLDREVAPHPLRRCPLEDGLGGCSGRG